MALIVTPRQLNQRAEFYQQLASLLSAGVALIQALEILVRNPPAAAFRQPLARLIRSISEGATLSESLLALGSWAPSFDLALIQAAEQSGRLPESFRLLAHYYSERSQLARRVIADLAYPAFLVFLALLVFPVTRLTGLVLNGDVVGFVAPKAAVLAVVGVVIVLGTLACQGSRGETWRAAIEKLLRGVPILGAARRHLALARLSTALEALISAGVSVFDSWELAAAASGSPALRRAVRRWHEPLRSGQTPAELLSRTAEFPELFANLYHTGEVSGQLDDTLRRLHLHYQEEGSRRLHAFSQWMPRLIYFGILLTIGYQVVRFWTNYYNNIFQQIGL